MANSRSTPAPTDPEPGIAATAAFLLLVFGLAIPIWLGAVLAALIYGGVWLLFRNRCAAPHLIPEAQLLETLSRFQRRIRLPGVRHRAVEAWRNALRLHQYGEAHPAETHLWRGIYHETLDATVAHLQRYLELEPLLGDDPHPAIGQMELLLDEVSRTFEQLRRRLADQEATGLETKVQLVRSKLHAVNELTLLNSKRGHE